MLPILSIGVVVLVFFGVCWEPPGISLVEASLNHYPPCLLHSEEATPCLHPGSIRLSSIVLVGDWSTVNRSLLVVLYWYFSDPPRIGPCLNFSRYDRSVLPDLTSGVLRRILCLIGQSVLTELPGYLGEFFATYDRTPLSDRSSVVLRCLVYDPPNYDPSVFGLIMTRIVLIVSRHPRLLIVL
jgi:hypothetical protein